MKRQFAAGLAIVCAVAMASVAAARVVPAGDVSVTVTYTGKGKVDEAHAILVCLFDHPVPTATSVPLEMRATTKSGATVTFEGVAEDPVYVVLVYDEASSYDGRGGPPPAGTPIGTYQKDGKPIPVKPGPAGAIKVSFDDSRRWK